MLERYPSRESGNMLFMVALGRVPPSDCPDSMLMHAVVRFGPDAVRRKETAQAQTRGRAAPVYGDFGFWPRAITDHLNIAILSLQIGATTS